MTTALRILCDDLHPALTGQSTCNQVCKVQVAYIFYTWPFLEKFAGSYSAHCYQTT